MSPLNPSLSSTPGGPSRRDFLLRAAGGFGALPLAYLLSQDVSRAADSPWAPRKPHIPPRAKSVIFVFIDGGPSHIDLFDPKPEVNRLAGKPLPASVERVITPMGVTENPLLACKRKFAAHGQSGIVVSDWLPHLAGCVDDISVIRSCWANGLNHVNGLAQMNTGSILGGRPSLGSWVSYGLGSENQDLPAFAVLLDDEKEPPGGSRNWGAGFMPASFQGTRLRGSGEPILHLHPPTVVAGDRQRRKLDLLAELNRKHAAAHPDADALEARIASYELAYRMQAAAPTAINLAEETAETQKLYGLDDKATEKFGRNCLLARRLVERGVRFVQLYCGSGSQWDAHANIEGNHGKLCRASDKPVAGLLADLKRRGMLNDTLVVWGGEFGRTPMSEKGDGRDHNPYGFSMWMAGGGIRPGLTIGDTDEFGLNAVTDRAHVHDLHATILHLLGLNHLRLTYLRNGRHERATIDGGELIAKLIA